ncbi:hypothetical protein [Pseudooceanicola sediminis]|nr:hypothetical protein [Pseudooceanicola sediminis]
MRPANGIMERACPLLASQSGLRVARCQGGRAMGIAHAIRKSALANSF